MLLYGIVILSCMTIIAVLNILFNPTYPWYQYVAATVILTIAVILLDGLVAGIIRKMPAKYFGADKKFFTAGKKELNFYRKIGVKKWKDHIPELGQFTGFHKDHIGDSRNNEYIERYLLEACYGVAGHFWSIPLSFLIVFLDYSMWYNGNNLWLTIAIPVAFVSAVLNYMPYCVLKFNIPKLKAVHKLNMRSIKKDSAVQ